MTTVSGFSSPFVAASSRLLVENARPRVNATDAVTTGGRSPNELGLALGRIKSLVRQIKDEAFRQASRGEVNRSQDFQSQIDRRLAEVSQLLGGQLRLGGIENAEVQGVNFRQLVDVEVLTLRPGADATFTGSLPRREQPASVVVENTSSLLSSGGTLRIATGDEPSSLRIQQGRSLRSLINSINGRSLGVIARSDGGGRLQLSTVKHGRLANIQVNSTPQGFVTAGGPTQITGQNPTQIESIEFPTLAPGETLTLSGSRDSLASSATLTYQGDGQARVTGSATFLLAGPAGNANLQAIEGESLSDFAQRVSDASAATGVTAEAVGNEVFFRSLDVGSTANIAITDIQAEAELSVTGVNTSQIDSFELRSLPDETEVILSGQITRAADHARLTYHGSTGGTVAETATFTVTGELGATQIAVTQGESLDDVRDRINTHTATTGVIAESDGDDLIFRSQQVGSSQNVQIQLDSITQDVDVSGVNGSQIVDFVVASAEPRSTNTLTGSVTQAATRAELTYNGFFGSTSSNATFDLTGQLGTATISVNAFQSLESVRDAINANSASTGVTASVSGNELRLLSEGHGSSAIVQVDVQSGTFNTAGGDGNGNAAGADAQLLINGDTVVADDNDVSYSDAAGSYTFTVTQGFTGAFDSITVTSTDRDFDVSGVDAQGVAVGVDAEGVFNGETRTATGTHFEFTSDGAEVAFATVDAFTGTIDPITLLSAPQEFTIVGGDGDGSATGADAVATIAGQQVTSSSNSFTVSLDQRPFTLTFADSFLGEFDQVTLNGGGSSRRRTQVERTYHASGRDTRLEVNGSPVTETDGRFVVEQNGVQVAFGLADGFSGTIDPFTVTGGKSIDVTTDLAPLSGAVLSSTRQALTPLFQLASGGELGEQDTQTVLTLSTAVRAFTQLQAVTGSGGFRSRSLLDVLA